MTVSKITRNSKEPFFGGRGVVVPFRPSSDSSSDSAPVNADSSPALPAHDDPDFEALHRKGVGEYLRSRQTPPAPTGDEPDEPGENP
jgi:hypothetical protein